MFIGLEKGESKRERERMIFEVRGLERERERERLEVKSLEI